MEENTNSVLKKCTICKKYKSINNFNKDSSRKDGMCSSCKECSNNKRILRLNKYRAREEIQYPDNKKCPMCKEKKTYTDFYKTKCNADGLGNCCKKCTDQMALEYRKTNRAKIHLDSSGQKICSSCGKIKYILEFGIDKCRPDGRESRCKMCKSIAMSIVGFKRRAIKKEVIETYNVNDRKITMGAFCSQCFNCGSQNDLTIDHYFCLNKKNKLTLENAIVLCRSCNSSKGIKHPHDFFTHEQIIKIEKIFDIIRKMCEYKEEE